MKIFGNETIIDKRAGKILIESEIINNQEIKWLKSLLEENNDNSVNSSQYKNLDNKYKTFLKSSLYQDLYKNASDEWSIDHLDESEGKLACSLCGQKDTKKKYYIKNKISGKMLNVGSTCINNFKDIRDINGKTVKEISKEWEIQQRKKALNDKYNGIIEKIDNWNKRIDEIPTIINGNFEVEYDRLFNQIQILYNKFIKNKRIDFSIANKINDLVCEGETILKQIHNDIDSKKDNEWYITKEIKEWCYKDRENTKTVINFLKEDGLVKWRSAFRIYEINFVKKILEKFKIVFDNSNIFIVGFNETNSTIIINIRDGNAYTARIDLECNYSKFVQEYGGLIFEKDKKHSDEKQFVIENSRINQVSSIDMSISNIKYLLTKKDIKVHSWDDRYNEIVFIENNRNYIIIKAKALINNFINYVFLRKLSEAEYDNLKKYVINNGEKISKEEYNSRIETREKAEKTMQVDYSKFV